MRIGFFVAAIATCYGPVRYFLDELRVRDVQGADPRWLDLTPAQYAAIAVFAAGLYLCVLVARRPAAYRMPSAAQPESSQRSGSSPRALV